MIGKFIVIEGLDGSGKATQAGLLAQNLSEAGEKVRKISFPNYDSDSSALVRMYLAGQFGNDPYAVNAYAASSFYAVDRYAGYKKDWGAFYHEGGIIIADRYTTSNAVHQCCKMPKEQWDDYLEWLFDFEYNKLCIPTPNQVIYLKLDVEISQRLMYERYNGDEKRKDIHESNLEYLRQAQQAADYCADKLGWAVVECYCDGKMRSIDEIQREILGVLTVGEGNDGL